MGAISGRTIGVRLSCMTRYFCIDKAKKRLGYKPLIGLREGLKKAVEGCISRRREQNAVILDTNKEKQ